jgi:hypothetical protein
MRRTSRPACLRLSSRPVWRLLDEGFTSNAVGKALQAWRALLVALPRLELGRLKPSAKTEEERRWLESTAVPGPPRPRLSPMRWRTWAVENISAWTDKALDLYGYKYHGPDPDVALSKYARRGELAWGGLRLKS